MKKQDSDEEFEFSEDDMEDMPSELASSLCVIYREEYNIDSGSDSDTPSTSAKISHHSHSFKGHPWSDSSDEDKPSRTSKGHVSPSFKEETEGERTRRSTRMYFFLQPLTLVVGARTSIKVLWRK